MLVHGLLGRSMRGPSHELSQLARSLPRALLQRPAFANALLRATLRAQSTGAPSLDRTYATAATKPTATVKRAVKAKAKATSAAAPKKRAAAKPRAKAATKTKRKTTTRAKAKPKAKKAAKKTRKPKKVLTEEEKRKAYIKDLRKKALREPVSRKALNAYNVFLSDFAKDTKDLKLGERAPEASNKYRALSPAELEHYNVLAREKTEKQQAEYRAWIHTLTPSEVHSANIARGKLRRLTNNPNGRNPAHTQRLEDDRAIARTRNAYSFFLADRHASGDLKGIKVADAAKLIATEWKALTEGEKKKYLDLSGEDKARYARESSAASST